jgi:LEA14-like dessication related protein
MTRAGRFRQTIGCATGPGAAKGGGHTLEFATSADIGPAASEEYSVIAARRPLPHPLRAFSALALFALAATGCSGLQQVLESTLARPSASIEGVRLSDIGLDQAVLTFDVKIQNPLSGVVPLRSVGITLTESGNPFLEGRVPLRGEVQPGGSEIVAIPVTLRFAEILRLASNVKPGNVIPYTAALSLEAGLPGGSSIQLPLETSGQLPVPAPPSVSISNIAWDEVSMSRIAGNLALQIGNPNDFPFQIQEIAYGLSLAGSDVANETSRQSGSVAGGQTGGLDVPIGFSPLGLGVGIVQTLLGSSASYALSGQLEVSTPFGPMSLGFDDSGRAAMSR